MPFISIAAPWIALGANVIPILPEGAKKPAVKGWAVWHSIGSPRIDGATYSTWARQFPDHNAAVLPGSIGAMVVDVDNPLLLDDVLDVCGPTDYRTISGREGGGVHLWYRETCGCSVGITPGVDVRAQGGYVIAPDSLHAKTGTRYQASDALAGALSIQLLELPRPRAGWRDRLRALGSTITAPTSLDLRLLADRVTSSLATRSLGRILRAIADGKAFAEPGGREQAIFWAVRRLADEWPRASEDAIVALFAGSAAVMEALAPVGMSIADQVRTKWRRFADERASADASAADLPERPIVQLGGDDQAVLGQVAAALEGAADCGLYRQGAALVTIDGPAEAERVAVELADVIAFQRDGEPCPTPLDLARKVCARPPDVAQLLYRRSSPVLRADGSIYYGPGYDHDAQAWCDGWAGPRVPDDLGRAQAMAAAARLLAWIDASQWAHEVGPYAWLAHVLTVAARPAIAGAVPAWVYTADSPGSGKTTLARAAGIVGGRCGDYTDPSLRDDAELARRLDAYASAPAVVLDNARGELRSALLEGTVTGGVLPVRRLYVGPVQVPWRTVLSITSNGAETAPDWIRRVIPVALNSDPRPASRDVLAEADQRLDLTADAVAIAAAWLRSGVASGAAALPGFAAWSTVVGGCVHWLFGVDVIASTRSLAEELGTAQAAGEILDAIEGWAGDRIFSARELWDAPAFFSFRDIAASPKSLGSQLKRLADSERKIETVFDPVRKMNKYRMARK